LPGSSSRHGANENRDELTIGQDKADVKYAEGGLEMKYRVLIQPDEDGVYVAECPSLPGCVSQGETREEAVANIQEAIEGYLESLKAHGDPIPPAITEEVVEVPE
jgi:predicted RNase H-like HicB family nuclease